MQRRRHRYAFPIMLPSGVRLPLLTLGRGVLSVIAATVAAFWVAICAAAPEFIWQGMRLALNHVSQTDVLAALLIGLVLAFFVEPLMERLWHLLSQSPHQHDDRQRDALFIAGLSLAFALVSICLHDAMTALISDGGTEHATGFAGLGLVLALTTAWAIVPFTITLAWLSARVRWIAVPIGITAASSSCIAGWAFAWSVQAIATTMVPCLAILVLGYRRIAHAPPERILARATSSVASVAVIWLLFAQLLDLTLGLFRLERFALYDSVGFWVDVRFYAGWMLGLVLAPSPHRPPGRVVQR